MFRTIRRAWKPLVATAALAGPTGYVIYYFSQQTRKAKKTQEQWPSFTNQQIDRFLTKNATYHRVPRPGGIVWNYTTAFIPANDPIEDYNANQIITRDESDPAAPGDLLFFAVMDGHSGRYTSELLSRSLIPTVATELANLTKGPLSPTLPYASKLAASLQTSEDVPPYADPQHINLAILSAFEKIDHALTQTALDLMAAHSGPEKDTPNLSQHPLALEVMRPILSGSCALLAVIDTAHRGLHVACTGDARAIAGVWEEGPDGEGFWRAYDLTVDQSGGDPREIDRIRSEHPPDEAYSVIVNGRLLGRLQPSRAFGDTTYKLDTATQHRLRKVFLEGHTIPHIPRIPTNSYSPPYLTAAPDVHHYKLDFLPLEGRAKSSLRFIILATDGLWDCLSSKDVVALVGGQLHGLRGSPSALPRVLGPGEDPTAPPTPRALHAAARPWAFVDENVSAHVIRNAYGGADEARLRTVLSVPPGRARRWRDDTTVTVVWWEDGREGAGGDEVLSSSPPTAPAGEDVGPASSISPQREYSGFGPANSLLL